MEELKLSVGTEEKTNKKLDPRNVKILDVATKEVTIKKNNSKAKIIICSCQYPGTEKPIPLDNIKLLRDEKIITQALWLTLDSKGLIQKGSPLAELLKITNSANIAELKNKEVMTVLDEKGYLVFKGY